MAVFEFTFVEGGTAENIIFDATLSEQHTHSARVTEFPVERGTSKTDDVRALPIRLALDAFVSDQPLQKSGIPQATSTQKRSEEIFDKLIKLKDSGTRILVSTGARLYPSMVIESVGLNRTPAVSNGMRLDIVLREIQVVSTQTVQIVAAERKGQLKQTTGPQNKKEPDPKVTEAAQTKASFARQAGAAAKRFFFGD